ncbi:MAG TPA: PAS domain S-box protein, partial [Anaerolineales bacterium]|nr:PAS domain S-box protein [Anaerolineales bacterium]
RFMQYLPGLAWIKDREGRYVYANAAAEKAFSTPREKLYGRTDEEIFPAETAAQFKKNDEMALVDEKGVQVTETLQHEDGVLHYSLVSKFPIPGPDGSTTLIGGTAFDITERKQAEEALRESEERFRAILRQATAGIVRKDAEGRFMFVNQAFCNMLGYTESELLGKTIWELTHAEDLEENKRLYHRAMIEGIPFKLEKRLLRKDGSILWVDVSVSPIIEATGTPQSAVAVEVDITARKQAEQALRESKELYRNLFDTVPVAVYTCDADGLIQEFNQRAVELWGREPRKNDPTEKYCGSFKIYYPDGRFMPHEECPMARILRGEALEAHELEILVERPDGTRRNIIPHPLALKNECNEIVGAINCLYDFTERKQAEEALHQLNLQLENRVEKRTVELQVANQSLRNEIAERLKVEDALHESRKRLQILSQRLVDVQEEERRAIARELHDRVGQSLSALNINLVILDNQISNHATQQIRTRMDDSIQLVSETINLVRDVMSDLRPPVLDDYGLEAALQSHVDAFKSRYGINVQFEKSDQPIPRLGASVEMTVLRIAQEALINVARHANAETVILSLTRNEKVVRLVIQDDGTGIISWQEANRPGSHGLTIMRERAEALGGDLKVSSVPGKGTKVEASIPIESGSEENMQKERHE